MGVIIRIRYRDGSTTTIKGSPDWIDRCLFNLPEEYINQIEDWSIQDA